MNSGSLDLTICVVLYRSTDVSRRFAREIAASLEGFTDWELIFYDNSPTSELADLAAYGTYRHDARNLGFSFANNQAILSGRYANIALINPDVFGFTHDFWDRLAVAAIGQPDVRFIKLLNEDGSHQDCVGEISSLSRALRSQPDYSVITAVQPIGMGIMAFMLTTRDIFARVGLLDCEYPLYAEDMDWCARAHRHGIPVVYDPRFSLTHLGGASAGDRWAVKQSQKRKYLAERIFIDKHFHGVRWLAMRAANKVKVLVRTRGA